MIDGILNQLNWLNFRSTFLYHQTCFNVLKKKKMHINRIRQNFSHLPKKIFLFQWKLSKMLFIWSFRCQDSSIFIMNFWSCREYGLIIERKRLISKFYNITNCLTISINTLANFSRSKSLLTNFSSDKSSRK